MSTKLTIFVTRVLSDQGREGHLKITTCRGEVQEGPQSAGVPP